MTVETVSIKCSDGNLIEADLHQQNDSEAIVLAMPETGGCKKTNYQFLAALAIETGMDVMMPNPSGFGSSQRDVWDRTTPRQHMAETSAVYDWLAEQFPGMPINATGLSYGGLMLAETSQDRPIRNMTLCAPTLYPPTYTNREQRQMDRVVETRMYRADAAGMEEHPIFDRKGAKANLPRTAVFVHSQDDVISPETTKVYADKFEAMPFAFDVPHIPHAPRARPRVDPEEYKRYVETMASWLRGE